MSDISRLSRDIPIYNKETDSLELSRDGSQIQVDFLPPLLPRSAWNSQVAFLRVLFRVKEALDRIEKEAGLFRGET